MTIEPQPIPPLEVADNPCGDDALMGTPYRALRMLGRGGMGRVFEVEHRELGTRCVVKLLHPELVQDQRHVRRLRLEARSLAKVASPHVVAVSDLGETRDGVPYVAMELLRGRTLREELRSRAGGILPAAEAIEWTRQMLAGLAAAHRIKIVHRDVKLDNVILCDATSGRPRVLKIVDFGIAKWLDAEATGMGGTNIHPHTQRGVLLGTPRYMAPEQASGQRIDGRTDVYSAGLVLYQLVAGRGPFAHHLAAMDLLMAQVGEAPTPPSVVAPQQIHPALEAAILKAIAKDPGERFQSAEEFSAALSLLGSTSAEASMTGPLPAAYRPTVPFPFGHEEAEMTAEAATLSRRPGIEPWVDETTTVVRAASTAGRPLLLAAFLIACAALSAAALYAIVRLLGSS